MTSYEMAQATAIGLAGAAMAYGLFMMWRVKKAGRRNNKR